MVLHWLPAHLRVMCLHRTQCHRRMRRRSRSFGNTHFDPPASGCEENSSSRVCSSRDVCYTGSHIYETPYSSGRSCAAISYREAAEYWLIDKVCETVVISPHAEWDAQIWQLFRDWYTHRRQVAGLIFLHVLAPACTSSIGQLAQSS